MSNWKADQVVAFFYKLLKERMTPEALETFLNKGFYARGSMSVHGFMGMLSDYHEKAKRNINRNKDGCSPQK